MNDANREDVLISVADLKNKINTELEEGLKSGKYFKDHNGAVQERVELKSWKPRNGTFGWDLAGINITEEKEEDLKNFIREMLTNALCYRADDEINIEDLVGFLGPWNLLKNKIIEKNLLEECIHFLDDVIDAKFLKPGVVTYSTSGKIDEFYEFLCSEHDMLCGLLVSTRNDIKDIIL